MILRQKPQSGIWLVDYEDPATGQRRRVSTGLKDKSEARKKALDIIKGEAEVRRAPKPSASHRQTSGVTVGDLFERARRTIWSPANAKSQATVKSNIKILSAVEVPHAGATRPLGEFPITEVNYTTIERLIEVMQAEGYAPGTIKRKLDALSKVFTMAASKWTDEKGTPLLTARPPFPSIKVRSTRDRTFTDEEEVAIFRAVARRHANEPARDWRRFGYLLRFLLDSGGRLGEVLSLKVESIDTRGGQSYVKFARWETKSDKPRVVPLTPAIVETLDYLKMTAGPDGKLFPFKSATAWYMWTNIRDDLGKEGHDLSKAVLHTFRHTCATRLAKRLPLQLVQKWLGHSSIAITAMFYTHLETDDLLDGVAILSEQRTAA